MKSSHIVTSGINEIEGILFKGEKIIVPTNLRREMLAYIHQVHSGIQTCMQRDDKVCSGQVCPVRSRILSPNARHAQNIIVHNKKNHRSILYEVPELNRIP